MRWNYNSRLVKYRQLGNTDIVVSELGFGGWAIGGPVDLFGIPVGWGGVNDQESRSVIHRALDLGVTLFDTADVYGSGHSEELLGQELKGVNCVIATKAGNTRVEGKGIKDFSEQHLRKQIESSLKRLNRECIDIFQLHNPPPEVWQQDEAFSLLTRLKQEGKIRACGVSISTLEEGMHLIANRKVDLLQILFNVLNQGPADELIPFAEKNGIGLLARVPLASGLLTGKYASDHVFENNDNRRNYLTPRRMSEAVAKVEKFKKMVQSTGYSPTQIALAFLRGFPVIPIPGAKTVHQLEQNVSAIHVDLKDDLFTQIRKEFASYNFYLRYRPHV